MSIVYVITGVVIGAAVFAGIYLLGYYACKAKLRKQMDEYNKYMLQKPGRLTSLLPSVENL